jgi:hypothetical protein
MPKLPLRAFASGAVSAAIGAGFLAFFGNGVWSIGSIPFWLFITAVFLLGSWFHGRVD